MSFQGHKKNTVICYYQPLDWEFSRQSEPLIEVWKKSWQNNGWNPVVLGEDYARQNPLCDQIDIDNPAANFYKTDNRNWKYHRSCYLRLLAYCRYVRNNGATMYADYDVINYTFTSGILDYMEENSLFKGERCAIYLGKEGAIDIEGAINCFDKNPGEISDNKRSRFSSSDMHVVQRYTKSFKLIERNLITREAAKTHQAYYCENAGLPGAVDSPLVHFDGGVVDRDIPEEYKSLTRVELVQKIRPV